MKNFVFALLIISFEAHAIEFKEWQKFSKEQKIEYLRNEIEEVDVSVTEMRTIDHILSAERAIRLRSKIASLTHQLSTYETSLPTEIKDPARASVGKLTTWARLYFSQDDVFLGARVEYHQRGCSHFDEAGVFFERGGFYKTVQEAEENGCINDDVSWSGDSIADETLLELEHSGKMVWSGF